MTKQNLITKQNWNLVNVSSNDELFELIDDRKSNSILGGLSTLGSKSNVLTDGPGRLDDILVIDSADG